MEDLVTLTRSLYGDLSPDQTGDYLFDNTTVEGFLRLAHSNPYRAAAMACRALSVDQVYLLKVVRTQDLQVNGAAVAAELRLIAQDLDVQADAYELNDDDGFEIIDFDYKQLDVEAAIRPWG